MPLVVVHRENKFNEVLRRLRNNGGNDSHAYKKIGEIRQSLELGERNVCQTTDRGESRLTNCIKYDLGNGYRLVTVDFGDVVMLCHAGKHDDVDRWLDANRGQKFTYDKTTKKITVVVEREVASTPNLPATTTPPEDTRPYLLQVSGLDWDTLVPIRSVRRRLLELGPASDERQIEEALQDLQDDVNATIANLALNLIIALREGQRDVAERHRDLFLGVSERASDSAPITKEVVLAEANSDTLVVLNDLSEAEFDALWDPARFQEWMLYLHPGQKRVVDEDFAKPCVFTGVSGSGKTCVLVHRALRLAKQHPNEPILIVTLNRSLAALIERLLGRLAGNQKHAIKVMAFYDYLESLLKYCGLEDFITSFTTLLEIKEEFTTYIRSANLSELGAIFTAREEYELEALWRQFCDDEESGSKNAQSRLTVFLYDQDKTIDAPRYLRDELTLVRSAHRIAHGYSGYQKYDRGGRCIQFQDKRREDVLRILRTWEKYQLRHGKLDAMGLTQAALVALDDHDGAIPEQLRFRAVLVDEFQDFSTLDLEILTKIPMQPLNGLFLTGDTAQKIYTKDLDLPRSGLPPADRINRSIQKNYRNSRQILEAAHLLIEAYASESTAKYEGITVLKPEYAQRDGAKPFVCETNDVLKAAWTLAGEWLASGYAAFSVCIATANPDAFSVRQIREACPVGISSSRLSGDYLLRPSEVVVSDIYNIKGFEFSLVVVVGMAEGQFPPQGVPAGEAWREALRLYVAMTRGRDEVCLVYQGRPSPFITAMSAGVAQRPIMFAETTVLVAEPKQVDEPHREKPRPVGKPVGVIEPLAVTASHPPPLPPTEELNLGNVSSFVDQAQVDVFIAKDTDGSRNSVQVPPPAPSRPAESVSASPAPVLQVLNGFTMVPIEGDPTVFSIAKALGRTIVQIHNDLMEVGVIEPPDSPIRQTFVYRIFEKYNCSPIFQSN